MLIGVLKETYPGERRVAMIPATVAALKKKGFDVITEQNAGLSAGFPDKDYEERGASLASRDEIFEKADILVSIRAAGMNPEMGAADSGKLRKGQAYVAMMDPLSEPQPVKAMAESGATAFALELMPRISRAQSMDVLSSMATIAGYKAVLLAAVELPRIFPLMMTAAGTIKSSKAFVVGAGVAGLQVIATCRRLGSMTRAYDVRPAVKEQVESLGARFVEMKLETESAEDERGYSKAMDEEFYRKQREMMLEVVAESDVVFTTAAVPGKKAPILVTEEMVKQMHPGSVIMDMAAERGGNCELTRPGETVDADGVKIMGPLNLASTVPYHASQMFSQNMATFLSHVYQGEEKKMNLEDQITAETMVCREGEVVNPRLREMLGLEPLKPEAKEES